MTVNAPSRGPSAGRADFEPGRGDPTLAQGTTLGRYVVLSRLGLGGMGVVYAAYDPQLDRKIALKLLRPDSHGRDDHMRLLREAQALAKLSHPNVVTIHDVGIHGTQVWLAMEFVAGQTLRAWSRRRRRHWREVVAVVVRAGRGIAAAHAVGLLHRDIKPDNIMVDDDGRVRVMDFGLARVEATSATTPSSDSLVPESEPETSRPPHQSVLAVPLTKKGALVGTPAYMAPEQLRGAPVDARTDQFSLCLTLWEALYGTRPGPEPPKSRRGSSPRHRAVPAWLRDVCARGLAVDPEQRWSDVEALLTALERGQGRARWRLAAVTAMALAVATAGVYAVVRIDRAQRHAGCEAEGASIEASWNAEARATLRDAMIATGATDVEGLADKTISRLDRYADRWRQARTEACADTRLRAVGDEDTLDRARWCLDQGRAELEAMVSVLARADAEGAYQAVLMASALPPVHACREEDALGRRSFPPMQVRDEVMALHTELQQSKALRTLENHREQALQLAEAALGSAEALGWSPLRPEARMAVGSSQVALGRYDEAIPTLEDTYFEAMLMGSTPIAIDAATMLAFVVGGNSDWSDSTAARWLRHTEVALTIGGYDDDDPISTPHLNNLALRHGARGEYDEAQALLERLLARQQRVHGSRHYQVASIFNNLGLLHERRGDLVQAEAAHQQALAIREQALGDRHPLVADSLNNLGTLYGSRGELERSEALHRRALAIREAALGPDHPRVADSLNNLGVIHLDREEYAQAQAVYRRVLAIREVALGPDHVLVAYGLIDLASTHLAMARPGPARPLLERCLGILTAIFGPDHVELANPLILQARVALAEQRPEDAVARVERALRLSETLPDGLEAEAWFVLARASWDANLDRARARELARRARDAYRAAHPVDAEALAEVEAWISTR